VGGMAVERQPRKRDTRVPRAHRLRRDMTDAERKLWWHLRRMPVDGTHFRRQATVGPYFADFACHERRLIIEVDGGQHNRADHLLADSNRSEYLESRSYRVLRFWNNDVLKNIDGVMESMYAVLRDSKNGPAPLTPPHRASRGGRGAERPRPLAEREDRP
jgi:very-short-patch-repair endonuclease